MGPVYEQFNCFHLAYLTMRFNKKVDVLRATDWLDSSHSHRNCLPSPFTVFFGIKQSLKDMATMTLKFKALRSNT